MKQGWIHRADSVYKCFTNVSIPWWSDVYRRCTEKPAVCESSLRLGLFIHYFFRLIHKHCIQVACWFCQVFVGFHHSLIFLCVCSKFFLLELDWGQNCIFSSVGKHQIQISNICVYLCLCVYVHLCAWFLFSFEREHVVSRSCQGYLIIFGWFLSFSLWSNIASHQQIVLVLL